MILTAFVKAYVSCCCCCSYYKNYSSSRNAILKAHVHETRRVCTRNYNNTPAYVQVEAQPSINPLSMQAQLPHLTSAEYQEPHGDAVRTIGLVFGQPYNLCIIGWACNISRASSSQLNPTKLKTHLRADPNIDWAVWRESDILVQSRARLV